MAGEQGGLYGYSGSAGVAPGAGRWLAEPGDPMGSGPHSVAGRSSDPFGVSHGVNGSAVPQLNGTPQPVDPWPPEPGFPQQNGHNGHSNGHESPFAGAMPLGAPIAPELDAPPAGNDVGGSGGHRVPAAGGTVGFDPESTAAWSLEADSSEQPRPGTAPGWQGQQQEQPPPGAGPIVPDSWFADPSPGADADATTHLAPPQQQMPPWDGPNQQEPAPWAQNGPGAPSPNGWSGDQGWGPPPNATAVLQTPPGDGYGPAFPPPGTSYGQPGFGPPNGPGGPYDQGQAPRKGKPSRGLLIGVGVLVAAAVLAVAYVMWPSGGQKGSPAANKTHSAPSSTGKTTAAHAQAVAVNKILEASSTSRGQLNGAIGRARKCEGLAAAVATMQKVAQDRQDQLNQANALQVGALKNGAKIKSTLAHAITISLNADQAFLKWAQESQGCQGQPKPNADKKQGERLSVQAGPAKREFARYWTPVAKAQNLPARGASF